MLGYDFFLSHNRAEKEWTRTLSAALRRRGASTFFDEDSIAIGDDIVTAIGNALSTSRHIVFVLSPASVDSRWVELEWTSALHADPDAQQRKVLPVLKEECEIPFLLRRLRHVDARDLDVAQVADLLMSAQPQSSLEREPELPQRRHVQTNAPLRFGAPQYVRRQSDSRLEEALRRGQAVLIYGPRMFGKSSMLVQVAAKERLRGIRIIWLDLQAHNSGDPDSFLEGIGYDIAHQLAKDWSRSSLPPNVRIARLLKESLSPEHMKVVLLLDEFDCITQGTAGIAFGNLLRAVLSNPDFQNFSCVTAGVYPPWMEEWPGAVSPWWNLFHLVRVSHFESEEVSTFLTWLGGGAEQHAAWVWEVTGGHPALVAKVGYEFTNGHAMADILADPLRPDGPLFAVAWMTVRSTLRLLKNSKDTLIRVRDGREVPRAEDREALWLMGLVTSPRDNSPVVSGTVFRELIPRLIEEL
jgi:hypothetical protein